MQRKVSSGVQRIHRQLMCPVIAGHLKCLTTYPWLLRFHGKRVHMEFLELFPLTCIT